VIRALRVMARNVKQLAGAGQVEGDSGAFSTGAGFGAASVR
jgi:hypothetical protein